MIVFILIIPKLSSMPSGHRRATTTSSPLPPPSSSSSPPPPPPFHTSSDEENDVEHYAVAPASRRYTSQRRSPRFTARRATLPPADITRTAGPEGGELPRLSNHVYVSKDGHLRYKKSTSLCLECVNVLFFALGNVCIAAAAIMFALPQYNTNTISAYASGSTSTATSAFSGSVVCAAGNTTALQVQTTSQPYTATNTFATNTSVGNITHADWGLWVGIGFVFYVAGFVCFIVVSLLSSKSNRRRDTKTRMRTSTEPQHRHLYPSLRNCPNCCLVCFKCVSCGYRTGRDIWRRSLVYFIVTSVLWFGAILLFYFLYGVNSSITYGPENTSAGMVNTGLFVVLDELASGCIAPVTLNLIQTETLSSLAGSVSLSGDNATVIPWWANALIMLGAILTACMFLFGWYKVLFPCCGGGGKRNQSGTA